MSGLQRVLVKVCGVTREDDVRACARIGVDWLGINCWPGSKRYVEPERAAVLATCARRARRDMRLVGVFVNQPGDAVRRVAERVGLDAVQLHGDEPERDCERLRADGLAVIKALGLASARDAERLAGYPGATVLADTPTVGYGGSGRTFDWTLARHPALAGKQVILAGGLTPENVARAIATTRPYAVDTASGVESAPGVKSAQMLAAFVAACRASQGSDQGSDGGSDGDAVAEQ